MQKNRKNDNTPIYQAHDLVLTIREAAFILGITPRTFYNARLEKGRLPEPAIEHGGKRYFARQQLEGLNIRKPRGGNRKGKRDDTSTTN